MPTPDHAVPSTSAETLRRVPLFRALEARVVDAIAESLIPLSVANGDAVFAEGSPGEAMYFIDSGLVQICAGEGESQVTLATLGAGQFFGEMALVLGTPRTATALALRDCELLELPSTAFRSLCDRFPILRSAVARVSEHRSQNSELFENETFELLSLSEAAERVTLGSAPGNTIVLDQPGVARLHAEIRRTPNGYRLVHLGGDAGTSVNQSHITEADLEQGDLIRLGSARLFLHDGKLKLFHSQRGIRVELSGVGRRLRNGRQLLRGLDLVLYPGELVGIVGPSGAGKSTLMKIMLGLDSPTEGRISYDGLALAGNGDRFRTEVGYVPQADIVHPELSARESLRYSGRLRLPAGTRGDALNQRVQRTLAQVHLEKAADTPLALVSGGQRKRACVAVELMTDPRLLFLDEPTSGLDPGLDEQFMLNFRELADAGRTVVVTTHATRNIAICDLVVILDAGHLIFVGSPSEALAYFNVADFAEIYEQIQQNNATDLALRFENSPERVRWVAGRMEDSPASPRGAGPPGVGLLRRSVRILRQLAPLIQRDARIAMRDRVNLALRLLGPPALGVSMVITFDRDIFALFTVSGGNARESITLLYLMAVINLFLSAITSSVAITRENAIFRREQRVNLSPVAYVASKFAVLSVFAVLQAGLILLVLWMGIDFPEGVMLRVFLALSLTSLAGMALGLFVSSLSPNADRAVIIAVLVIIPQLIFGGSTVPREVMQPAAKSISDTTVSKWSLELLGSTTGIESRLAKQTEVLVRVPGSSQDWALVRTKTPFDHAFEGSESTRWAALVGFILLFIAGTVAVLELKPRIGRLRG